MHVLTVVGGFGLRVIPHAPFEISHDAANILWVRRLGSDPRSLQLRVDQDSYKTTLGPGTSDLAEVVDVEEGPTDRHWLLQTSRISLPFPKGYTLRSVPDGSASPFDLFGENEEYIYLQSTGGAFSTSQLIADGQTVVEQAADLLEATYEHAGDVWHQRHRLIEVGNMGVFVLTVQVRRRAVERARAVLDEMAARAQPT